ncbi:UNKNOWN [Stylonychia lemnae]|uniref:Uncharacterized protein n=1 Tax=Stylonychia lemnae TaxID=5949 RepID=A0A078AAN8_STYLE|nr:UNKNOWN [Stylonychia lemnae]|eukprot:CDW78652.1 UNKNOWN [Stylonychia lemnae]
MQRKVLQSDTMANQLLGLSQEQADQLETCPFHDLKKIFVCLYDCDPDTDEITYCLACKSKVDQKNKLVHNHKDEYIHVIAKEMSNQYYEIRGKYEELVGKFDGSYSDSKGLFTKYSDLLEYLKIQKLKLSKISPQNQYQAFQLDNKYKELKEILEQLQDYDSKVNDGCLKLNAKDVLGLRRKLVEMNDYYAKNFQYLEQSITEQIWNGFRDVFLEGDLSNLPEFDHDNYRFFTEMKERATKLLYESRLTELTRKQNEQEQQIKIMQEQIEKLMGIVGE